MHPHSEDSQTRCWTLMKQISCSFIARRPAIAAEPLDVNLGQPIQIDILPDEILLEIFYFYTTFNFIEEWKPLVHVCRRWRSLVFASPRRLNLQLYCTNLTPARDKLHVWPALPLIISGNMSSPGTDNVIAALGQNNRARQVGLGGLEGRHMEQVLAVMQVPFPELTQLELYSHDKTLRLIPDSFLGGYVPRLQYVYLSGIPFPGLPRLLSSAPHLVQLILHNIPHSGYILPEAIANLLSVLSSLESLSLGFESSQSRPDLEPRRPPPPIRSVISALENLYFIGVTEYLEDLVSFIDTPQLGEMRITFFNQTNFYTPRLAQFINRTPKLAKPGVYVQFFDHSVYLQLHPRSLYIAISCGEPDSQLSSLKQICRPLHLLSTVVDLYIEHGYWQVVWKDDIENTLWLQLLLPFTAVKNLYLSKEFSQGIAGSLKELAGGRMTEVLPSLENIFVAGLEPSGRFQETVEQFVAARQLSGHPVIVSGWSLPSGLRTPSLLQ